MMIDEELLGYYIDCHGAWPDSFVWVFMMLFQQTMEAQAQALLEEWFGVDDRFGIDDHGAIIRRIR